MKPTFKIKLGQPILSGLAVVGKCMYLFVVIAYVCVYMKFISKLMVKLHL